MIGHRVRVVLSEGGEITGVLHKLGQAGVRLSREQSLPEQDRMMFLPMHRIHEIIDLGRVS